MKHKVRPFAKRFDLLDINALAEVRDGRFLLKIGKLEHAIPAMETGSDEFGEYAFILDQRVDLGFGCWLLVEPEYDETDALLELDPGCCVRFDEPADDIIHQMGVDPNRFNLLVPPHQSISVYFSSGGRCNGFGGMSKPLARDDESH